MWEKLAISRECEMTQQAKRVGHTLEGNCQLLLQIKYDIYSYESGIRGFFCYCFSVKKGDIFA